MTSLEKHSAESRIYEFDFSRFPEIVGGETIDSVTSVSQTILRGIGSSLTIGLPVISSPKVQVRISGGTANEEWLVTCTIATSGDNILVGKGKLLIKDI